MSRRIRLMLPLIFLLLCSQYENTAAQNNDSPAKLQKRMRALIDYISSDPTFPAEQVGDMSVVMRGLISLIDDLTRSGMMNQTRMLAILKSSAAAINQILVVEGDPSLYKKTSALANAIRYAYLETMGYINEKAVDEMRELANMFARDMSGTPSASDMGPSGPGQYVYGQGAGLYGQYGSSAASAAAAVGQLGPAQYGAGPASSEPSGGPGFGASGPGSLGTGAGAVQPGQGPYRTAAGYGATEVSLAAADVSGPYSSGPGQPSGTSVLPMDSSTVSNSVSRLSSSSSSARVSSAVSTLLSSGGFNPSALGGVIADLSNSVSISYPGISGCEALVQVLLEVIASLVHILSSSSVDQLSSSPAYASSVVGQSISNAFGG